MENINAEPEVIRHLLKDDGKFPNSSLFVLIYKKALALPDKHAGRIVKDIFKRNNWKNSWKNGIYDYHHYHSITHEVLGVYRGSVSVQLGGPDGVVEKLEKGDVIIIPAGVAHKNVGSDDEFKCVGAYPEGMDYDMNYGKSKERPAADENIKKVPLPDTDPVYGEQGPIRINWEMW